MTPAKALPRIFDTTYELTGRSDQVFLAARSKHLGINGCFVARGEMTLPDGTAFVHGKGRCVADILGTGFASLYLISARMIDGLTAERITGWRSQPVHFDDNTAHDGDYHALVVTGRCGPIVDEMSETITKILPGGAVKWWRGMYFDPKTWDGSDVFTPADRGTVLIVPRVRELLRRYDLDGVEAIPLSAIERPIFP